MGPVRTHDPGLGPYSDTVRSSWLLSSLWWLAPAAVAGIGLVVLRAYALHQSFPLSLVGAMVGMGIGVLVLSFGFYLNLVRRIDLGARGVRFWVGLRTVEVGWSDLVPPMSPYFVTAVFRYRLNGKMVPADLLGVSRAQARAILLNPGFPRTPLDPKVAHSLVIDPIAPAA